MAESDSDADKTEDPTAKKLEEARKRGNVSQSREVLHWAVLLGGGLSLMTVLPGALGHVAGTLKSFIEKPHEIPADGSGLGQVLYSAVASVAGALAVPIGMVVLLVVLVALAQTGFVFSLEAVKPTAERISLLKGVKRLVSLRQLMEFIKSILKLALVVTIVFMLLRPELGTLQGIAGLEVSQVLVRINGLAIKLFMGVVGFMSINALADFLYQKYEYSKGLRMSKTEIKDEYKQTEGDPKIKGRIRQIRVERARQRMIQAVPEADVVITNPTHFAVALNYDMEDMAAPRVVAKGADFLAHKIRSVAEENEVPIVENPPLARALYAGVEVDQEIPLEHYKAVAEVIGYVYRLQGKILA